jgi:hypothetical protein
MVPRHPQVEGVMQEQVRQKRAYDALNAKGNSERVNDFDTAWFGI